MRSTRYMVSAWGMASVVGAVVGCGSQPMRAGLGSITSAQVGDCASALAALDATTAGVECTASPDLTTANPNTTPPDNSIAGLAPGAYAPRGDRGAVAAGATFRTPITKTVPGLQIRGAMAGDSGARWVIRLPNDWNGRLVMAASASTRSEYAGDWIHSDYLVQRGYAYVSTNKGMLNSRPGTASDPKVCHLSPPGVPTSAQLIRFYMDDDPTSIQRWYTRTAEGTAIAKKLAQANYGTAPAYTYVVGFSAGGAVVRRMLEEMPDQFDGGLDWSSPPVEPGLKNGLLAQFPVGLRNFPDYAASGYSTSSSGYQAMQTWGYPPDVFASGANPFSTRGSYLETFKNNFWNLLACSFVGALDPTFSTTAPAPLDFSAYDYEDRKHDAHLARVLADVGHSGGLRRPMISIGGTMDALALIDGARNYRNSVVAAGASRLHRLYEIQNGSHLDRNPDPPWNFTQVERVSPHFGPAFERLVSWVESGVTPPAGQCIPRSGSIADDPSSDGRVEHCANLLE